MANFTELLFLVHLFGLYGAVGYKLLNIFHKGEKYGWRGIVLTFVGMVLTWFFGFMVILTNLEVILYTQLFRLSTLILLLGVFLTVIEIILALSNAGTEQAEAYSPKR